MKGNILFPAAPQKVDFLGIFVGLKKIKDSQLRESKENKYKEERN